MTINTVFAAAAFIFQLFAHQSGQKLRKCFSQGRSAYVCEVSVVCRLFQWGTHLTSQVGTNSHWVVPSLPGSFRFFFFFKLPPLEPSWYSPALNDTESVCAEPLFVIPACETKIRAKNSSIRVSWPCRHLVDIGVLPACLKQRGTKESGEKRKEKKSVVSRPRSDHVSSPHLISLKRVN